jgi:signal transduction histidine kinase
MMSCTEFVLDEAGDRLDDEHQGFLREILAAAYGMKRLIDNLLDVSVIESGHLRLERTRTDVAKILAGVLPLVRLVAARKKVELLTEEGDNTPPLAVDVAKLQQVLVNLVSNAIEHSKAGQRVWLALAGRTRDSSSRCGTKAPALRPRIRNGSLRRSSAPEPARPLANAASDSASPSRGWSSKPLVAASG